MKLLVFAHVPPPHHGQSVMVQLLLEQLGGLNNSVLHIDARLSQDSADVGRFRVGKIFVLLRYVLKALGLAVRHRDLILYYIPAPPVRNALRRDWIFLTLCRPFFRKIVFHWHAVGLGEWVSTKASRLERAMTLRLHGQADLSLVLTEANRDDAATFRPKNLRVLPNGIPDPCPEFEKDLLPLRRAKRDELARRGGDVRQGEETKIPAVQVIYEVLFLSLCAREKGLFDAISGVRKANERLRADRSTVRVRLTVAGNFRSTLEREELAALLKTQTKLTMDGSEIDSVRYVGFVEGAEKKELFRHSDCFCFPTFYEAEGLSLVLLEAMAFGLPIVTTRWRALPTLFPNDYPGIVPPHDIDAIAEAILGVMSGDLFEAMRRLYQARYSDAEFGRKLRAALSEIGWSGDANQMKLSR